MDTSEIAGKLRASVGKTIQVTFGGHSETVSVISVDPDGFICCAPPASPEKAGPEFWIAYGEVSEITEP